MTEVQLKQGLLSAVQSAQSGILDRSSLTSEEPETELLEALNVLEERLPSVSPQVLFLAIMGKDLPNDPQEISSAYRAAESSKTDSEWEKATSRLLLMCLVNLREAPNSPIDPNPSLHDPER